MKVNLKSFQVFSNLLLLNQKLKTFLKNNKADNFIGGLVIGAIFSLIVNIFTVQLQETINKQKYYEALEYEISSHLIEINRFAENYIDANMQGNIYNATLDFSTEVWDSGLSSGYVFTLDQKTQAELIGYYSYLDAMNKLIGSNSLAVEEMRSDYLKCIYLNNDEEDCEELEKGLKDLTQFRDDNNFNSAKNVFERTENILNSFHPTKDRIEDPILKWLMGDKAMELLVSER